MSQPPPGFASQNQGGACTEPEASESGPGPSGLCNNTNKRKFSQTQNSCCNQAFYCDDRVVDEESYNDRDEECDEDEVECIGRSAPSSSYSFSGQSSGGIQGCTHYSECPLSREILSLESFNMMSDNVLRSVCSSMWQPFNCYFFDNTTNSFINKKTGVAFMGSEIKTCAKYGCFKPRSKIIPDSGIGEHFMIPDQTVRHSISEFLKTVEWGKEVPNEQ